MNLQLIQAISLVINANHAAIGCKSGNERTGFELARLNLLLLDQDFIIPDRITSLDALRAFNNGLDQRLNDRQVAGFANFISYHDQWTVPKISPELRGLRLNTNAAESRLMTNLVTDSVASLQAHTNTFALKQLSSSSGKVELFRKSGASGDSSPHEKPRRGSLDFIGETLAAARAGRKATPAAPETATPAVPEAAPAVPEAAAEDAPAAGKSDVPPSLGRK